MTNVTRYTGRGSQRRFAEELMGKRVSTQTKMVRRWSGNAVEWVATSLAAPLVGWVTGLRYVQNGDYESRSMDYACGDYAPPFLAVSGCTAVALVAAWPSRKPVHVPLDAMNLTEEEPSTGKAWGDGEWDNRAREEYRKAAIAMPRDAKGRFTK